jgi:hypothetical protein
MAAVSLTGAPLGAPLATVLPAPAASSEQLGAARAAALAPDSTSAAAVGAILPAPVAAQPAAAGAPPGSPLEVPREFLGRLAEAVGKGRADARAFAGEHTRNERWMIVDWALLNLPWPPKTDTEELAYLHDVARTRTDDGVARARFWADHGMTDEWERKLDDYARRAGPVQAKRARKLLHDVLMRMNPITQTAKSSSARARPFAVDPTLPLAVDRPGNNPSYPSGHTSAAYAACTVLAHLMPDRAQEFMSLAREASWARVYAGVHFPSDVLAGARLATTVASYLAETSGVRQVRGTAPAPNPGVAGGRARRALPGAVALGGAPIVAARAM